MKGFPAQNEKNKLYYVKPLWDLICNSVCSSGHLFSRKIWNGIGTEKDHCHDPLSATRSWSDKRRIHLATQGMWLVHVCKPVHSYGRWRRYLYTRRGFYIVINGHTFNCNAVTDKTEDILESSSRWSARDRTCSYY